MVPLPGRLAAVLATSLVFMGVIRCRLTAISSAPRRTAPIRRWFTLPTMLVVNSPTIRTATDC